MKIALAEDHQAITRCLAVMRQLRTKLELEGFIEQIGRQQKNAYQLVFVEDAGRIAAVAGFRIYENLAYGKFLFVDDLVTDEGHRSKGYGDALFDWLVDYAKEQNCEQLHLDSGVQRYDAHRFYLRKRMDIVSHHFALKLV